jgi:hypothetical protein
VIIVMGPYWGGLFPAYRHVDVAGQIDDPYAMPYETGPIYVLRGLKIPFKDLWPTLKHYE